MNNSRYYTPKEQCELNVKVLSSGYYGYILEDKAIFKSYNIKTANKFAAWANSEVDLGIIVEKAVELQRKEKDILLPNIFDLGKDCRPSHFYESVLKEKI